MHHNWLNVTNKLTYFAPVQYLDFYIFIFRYFPFKRKTLYFAKVI